MQRITITIDDDLVRELDRVITRRGYQNRSEAIRDLVRAGLPRAIPESQKRTDCIAALIYTYEHGVRQLPQRLQTAFHDHHDLTVATTRVPLDHDACIEVAILKGPTRQIEHFAAHVIAERGVRHGQLVTVPAELERERHAHGKSRPHLHSHLHVK
ncbi:MAG: nickel-responsive transcriptional regulator NikR [Pseudorhodoplanes sp.]